MIPYDDVERWKSTMRELDRLVNPLKYIYNHSSATERAIQDIKEREAALTLLQPFENKLIDAMAAFRPTIDFINSIAVHSPAFDSVARANASVAKLLDENKSIEKIVEQALYIDSSWRSLTESLRGNLDLLEARQLALEKHYSQIMDCSVRAHRFLSKVSWSDFGSALSVQIPILDRTKECFVDFTDHYERLVESFTVPKHSIASLPPVVSGLPPVEILTGSHLVTTISNIEPDEDEDREYFNSINVDVEESLESSLSQLGPEFVQLWRGAKEALQSTNPDRKRHLSISLRELLTHTLHTLAPDDQVRDWTSDDKLYHDGRPTRKARLLFICRSISNDAFEKFVEKDVVSTLSFLDLFQEGTHQLNVQFSDSQLRALVLQAESRIRFLLSISSTT